MRILVRLAILSCCAAMLRADSSLWTNGIIGLPTYQGHGSATVAYDGDLLFMWIGQSGGIEHGFLEWNGIVLDVLMNNDRGDFTPVEDIDFFSVTPMVAPGHQFRLVTSDVEAARGSPVPPTVFESAPFTVASYGRPSVTVIPEPGSLWLLSIGLALMLRRR